LEKLNILITNHNNIDQAYPITDNRDIPIYRHPPIMKNNKDKPNMEYFNLIDYKEKHKEKYIVVLPNGPLNVYMEILQNFEKYIPQDIILDSQKGRVTWFITDFHECLDLYRPILYQLTDILKTKKIIIASAANFTLQQNLLIKKYLNFNHINNNNLLSWLTTEQDTDLFNQKIIKIKNKQLLIKKAVCYSHRFRFHRLIVTAWLMHQNYHKDTYLSFLNADKVTPYMIKKDPGWDHYKLNYLKPNAVKISKSPIIIQNEREEITIINDKLHNNILTWSYKDKAIAKVINPIQTLNSYFHIVLETYSDYHHEQNQNNLFKEIKKINPNITKDILVKLNSKAFVTEKSIKPFAMMQPFVIFGAPYQVRSLKEMGFNTFDKWIDHSYDIEIDDCRRMNLFLTELDRLFKIDEKTWSNLLFDMLPDLTFNYYKQLTYTKDFHSELIRTLHNVYYE
jgi:hypothetical protein